MSACRDGCRVADHSHPRCYALDVQGSGSRRCKEPAVTFAVVRVSRDLVFATPACRAHEEAWLSIEAEVKRALPR